MSNSLSKDLLLAMEVRDLPGLRIVGDRVLFVSSLTGLKLSIVSELGLADIISMAFDSNSDQKLTPGIDIAELIGVIENPLLFREWNNIPKKEKSFAELICGKNVAGETVLWHRELSVPAFETNVWTIEPKE